MRRQLSFFNNQHGAIAPMVAILLVALLLIVALVVDLGHIHNAKLQLQQAADAAALAGAGQLGALSGAADLAVNAAKATITANEVLDRSVKLDSEQVIVTPGHWDVDALNDDFVTRWHPGSAPYNGVRVQAQVEVDHTFYLFSPNTTVPVDALAVQDRTELTIPLTIVSCIPSTGPHAGELTACGIKTYTFSSNENTAGWTALTLGGGGGASQQEIAELFDADGSEQFNRIAQLLNETTVVPGNPRPSPWDPSYLGCEGNFGENIVCGLGGDFSGYLAPTGDPLTRYAHLPRYITLSDKERDAFADIITQDGVLKQTGTNYVEFQTRLESLYNSVGSPYNPFGDGRFFGNGTDGEQLIRYVNDKFDFDHDGITNEKVYIPDYNKAIGYAGYPPVAATTGSMTTVMAKLLEKVTPALKQKKDIQFSAAQTNANPPLDSDHVATSGAQGETLLFTIPVIFAGACGGFDPSSFDTNTAQVQEDNELHYVGLANFLVTRIWKGGDCYECRDPVVLAPSAGSLGCNLMDHLPALLNGDSYACPVPYQGGAIAFEGLIRPPGIGEGPTGVRTVTYLVE